MERAATRRPAFGASAHAADAAVKTASPVTNTRRRPKRSPSAAAVMIPAANASVNALIVHSSCARSAPISRWMAGSAVTTTSASSVTMRKATDVRVRVQAGEERFIGDLPVLAETLTLDY